MLSKSELAYEFLHDRILDGRFSPGFRLVLGQIAQQLDMSVVPVREAIRRLEAEGLVTFEKNVGAQVALIRKDEYRVTMETLAIVEGAATAMSAPTITADQLVRARALNAQLEATLEDFDPQRFTELNEAFHSVLFENCPNEHLLDLVHRGWKRLGLLRDSSFGFVPGRARASVTEHEGLLTMIEGNASALEIELAARRHRTTTLEAILNAQPHLAQSAAAPTDLSPLGSSSAPDVPSSPEPAHGHPAAALAPQH